MNEVFRSLILAIFIILGSLSVKADSVDHYLFRQIHFDDVSLAGRHEQMLQDFDAEHLGLAQLSANQLIKEISTNLDTDGSIYARSIYAKVLTNAAIISALSGDRASAKTMLDKAVVLAETINPFHEDLFQILSTLGYIQVQEKLFPAATGYLRRAQHITHRADGVYAKQQLPVIRNLALIKIEQGRLLDADREQRFNLKVSEHAFGSTSEEIVPILKNLGNYFSRRGYSIPKNAASDVRLYRDKLFRESVELFERSVAIIENKYGDEDLRLVELLQGLSRIRYMRGSTRSIVTASMERAAHIVSSSQSSDVSDIAQTLVDLGDTYLLTNDRRALDTYLSAWGLLSQRSSYADLRYDLFGTPKRLYPDKPTQFYLTRKPANVEEGEELYVDLEYDIRFDGRVNNIKILEGNVPNSQKKRLKDYLYRVRFRPQIVNGEFTQIERLRLHQTFYLIAEIQDIDPGSDLGD